MDNNKDIAQPCAAPVYSIRKNGVICCQSTLRNCGFDPETMQELRVAGFELYINGEKAKR